MNRLDAMRKAGTINIRAIESAIALVCIPRNDHLTLLDLDELIESIILKGGCQPAFKGYRGYPATACISVNDVAVHGIPSSYQIQPGDLITIDVGTSYEGWCVDAARSFVVPQSVIDSRCNRRTHLVEAAQAILSAELETIKDGISLCDIASAGEKEAERQGVNLIIEYGGHQIGESIHLEPFIPNGFDRTKGNFMLDLQKRRLSKYKLKTGQVICLEPVITIGNTTVIIDKDGWTVRTSSGNDVAHTERCLIVKDKGYELLT